MGEFRNFKYYHGEEDSPFDEDSGKFVWWKIEKYAYEANDEKEEGLSLTMVSYIKERLWEGDGQHDTSLQTMLRRAEEMYQLGVWSRVYLNKWRSKIPKS